MLSFWRFLTLVLAALGLTMTSAHVLEMPQKMATAPHQRRSLLHSRHPLTLSRRCGRSCGIDGMYGYAVGFLLHLLGFCALVVSVTRETDEGTFAGPRYRWREVEPRDDVEAGLQTRLDRSVVKRARPALPLFQME